VTTSHVTCVAVDVVADIECVPSSDDDDDDDESSSSVVENHVGPDALLDGPRNGARTALSAAGVDVSINSELSRVSSPADVGE